MAEHTVAHATLTHPAPSLPPEPVDGTWLHVPDLHGHGYADVLRRDDMTAYTDPDRVTHLEHWWSFHRRTWLDWADAVRLGAATARTMHLVEPAGQAPAC